MDEDDIKDVLRRALPDELPPGELDRARLLRDGHRLRRRRRVLGLGGTGAAAVAAVAVAVGVAAMQAGPDTHRSVPAGPRASARATPSHPLPSPSRTRPETDQQRMVRLTGAVKNALGHLVPEASYSVGNYPPPTDEYPPLQLIQRQHRWYEGKALLTTAAGTGSIDIGIMPADGTDAAQVAGCGTPDNPPRYQKGTFACTTRYYNGLAVSVRTERNPNGARIVHVAARLDAATVVSVEVSNIDPNDASAQRLAPAPNPRAAKPVVSDDQAVALATDPSLSLG
ncbi:hypothetical protein [Actinocatenispora sera]|uniref:Uncharacterized protein n=1 Tax=Actinocatenispora sera TaxID=390989 RepID=A0A810KTS5_9ACTN|nr:hypothetical protein [Actinocatenispora sera]BCJ26257.1 hypothetical protein Asera_03650 [Actinocatenispora sera]